MTVTGEKVVIVDWKQLPKELRNELKSQFENNWKNDTFVELYTDLPVSCLATHQTCRDWLWEDHANYHGIPVDCAELKNEWMDLHDIGEDEGLESYLSHLYSEKTILTIFGMFPDFEVTDETMVLLKVSW